MTKIARYVFETAFNETPGEWRAVVTHVNTGSSREARFTVGPTL